MVLSAAEGSGQLTTAEGSFHALQAGAELKTGTQIRSGRSPVRLVVAGNFELELAAKSLISIEAGNGREVFVRLRRGQIDCQVSKRRYGQKFAILAGSHRVSVIGTEFRVSYPRVGDVSVQVSEGAVRVDEATSPWQRPGDTTMVVRAGHRWRAHSGKLEMGPVEPNKAVVNGGSPAVDSTDNSAPSSSKTKVQHDDLRERQVRHRATQRTQNLKDVQVGPTLKSKRALPQRKPKALMRARGKSPQKSITIEVPPQRMSDDEVRRAKELEKRQNPDQ
ncbi:MAG TPA: hypothetical protein DCQ06_11865 [Myxococcales bacterium]|nr:hypothetical protein [Myxococcales bacterium]